MPDGGAKVLPGAGTVTVRQRETTFSLQHRRTGAMSETLRMDYLVSLAAYNRVCYAVSSSQSRTDACLARPASLATVATYTLEALHNLTRSGASSPPSRMSPAAPLPEAGIPVR